jgi:hypothetical protein
MDAAIVLSENAPLAMTPTHHPHILKTKQLVKDHLNSTHVCYYS